jgi:hypothetical protein
LKIEWPGHRDGAAGPFRVVADGGWLRRRRLESAQPTRSYRSRSKLRFGLRTSSPAAQQHLDRHHQGCLGVRPSFEHEPGLCDGVRATLRWAWRRCGPRPIEGSEFIGVNGPASDSGVSPAPLACALTCCFVPPRPPARGRRSDLVLPECCIDLDPSTRTGRQVKDSPDPRRGDSGVLISGRRRSGIG